MLTSYEETIRRKGKSDLVDDTVEGGSSAFLLSELDNTGPSLFGTVVRANLADESNSFDV